MASETRTPCHSRRNFSLLAFAIPLIVLFHTAFAGLTSSEGATVTLGDLVQPYDGAPKPVSVLTDPPDLSVSIIYDGSLEPPSEPGSYTVLGVVDDPLFAGIAKDTLTISPAITNVTVPPDATYGTGQTFQFSIAYYGNVSVFTNEGVPSLSIRIGDSLVEATCAGGDVTNLLVFTYTIQDGDSGTVVMPETISLNGSAIQDSGGYDAMITFSPPSTSGVIVDTTIAPPPPPDDQVQIHPMGDSSVRLTVTGAPNASYVIQTTGDFSSPNWRVVGVAPAGDDGIGSLDVPIQPGSQFFRSWRVVSDGNGPR